MSLIRELKRRNVVRMALFYLLGAWVVLQVADVVVGVAGLPDWTLRLVGLVLLLGLPLALVFSWVYRLTPEGLRKDISIDDSGRRVVVTPVQRLILVASFAVIVAGGYVLIDRFMIEQHQIAEQQAQAQGPTRPENVVMAVMPFEVHGEEPESDEPRQRVRRAVARMIERLGDIRVVPEERVLALEGTDLTDPKLAEELSATHIVHGREWHSEEGTRFAVRLMDPTSGERLWAMEFERPLVVDDEMQPEAWARLRFEINRALSEAGLTDMTLGTESVTAMQALEKAGRSEEPERWYREALMLDPEFAEAHVEFAFHLANQTSTGVPWQEIGELATEHAKRAFELESDSPEVNAVLSRVLRLEAIQNYNSESAEHARLIERSLEHALAAVQSAPRNLNIRLEYIRGLWAENQWDEVVEQLEILRSYAPGAGYLGDWMINPLLWAGKIDEAEALLVQLKSECPDRDWAHSPSMHTIHRARGDLV
ncbi:MAG: hypothetical protein R3348_07760, partial [Xanthomonadales bacterium]|nr:hypothetical protein [Xanthomonadales bacterium]